MTNTERTELINGIAELQTRMDASGALDIQSGSADWSLIQHALSSYSGMLKYVTASERKRAR